MNIFTHFKKCLSLGLMGLMCLLLSVNFLQAQDISGTWYGRLRDSDRYQRIVFHIEKTADGYTSKMDRPDNEVFGVPVASTGVGGTKVVLNIPKYMMQYIGDLVEGSLVGRFSQGGSSISLTLSRTPIPPPPPRVRSQTPRPPFPYRSEDVVFENTAAGLTLAGTLTLPAKGSSFPAVILVSGSGSQDRNGEVSGHQHFWVLADYLTRQGIAVLRYDDRDLQSVWPSSTATMVDYAEDVESALAYLKTRKEIDTQRIGLIGRSEGGLVASMVAARTPDLDFMILLAVPGLRGDQVRMLETEASGRASGHPKEQMTNSRIRNGAIYQKIMEAEAPVTEPEMRDLIWSLRKHFPPFAGDQEDFASSLAATMTRPWQQHYLRYDPAPTLRQVKCPVLVANGSKNLHTPPKENLAAIAAALQEGGNTKVTITEYSGLNSLFQKCQSGLPSESVRLTQTFSPKVMKDIARWILTLP